MAGKTILTDEIKAIIVAYIRDGNSREATAKAAGIGRKTLFNWIQRGQKEGSGAFYDLWQEVEQAEGIAITRNIKIVQDAAKKSWQAAAWWLERKFPETWSRDAVRIRELEREVAELEKLVGNVKPQTTTKETQEDSKADRFEPRLAKVSE